MFKTVAIILAAGQGKRMGSNLNKQYLCLLDKPLLVHTLEVFEKHPLIDGIIIVARKDEMEYCYEKIIKPFHFTKIIKIVAGGKERQDSVFEGIKKLPEECGLVVVHDGARPLIDENLIIRVITKAQVNGASIVAVPVKDTIKKVAHTGIVESTLPRSELWAVQTPQVFQKNILKKAYEEAQKENFYGTDDASLVEKLGLEVRVVFGSYENIKITTPEDLEIAQSILAKKKA